MKMMKYVILVLLAVAIDVGAYGESTSEFEKGVKLFKQKDYTESFPIFYHMCNYEDFERACFYLGLSYQYGLGVKSDSKKALQIYRKFSTVHDGYKIQEARVYEYNMDNSTDSINKAMVLYSTITNSNVDWVAKKSKAALERIPIYNLFADYIKVTGNYLTNKIKYDTLHQQLNSISTNQLPSDLREKFISMRDICLKNIKNNDNALLDTAKIIGMTAIKSFIGGYGGLGESMIEVISDASDKKKIHAECNQRTKYFFEELDKYELSGGWVNNIVDTYYPNKK